MPTKGRKFTAEYLANRKILLADNPRCWMNPQHKATEADHVKPYSKGGGDELSNLRPICKSCNSRRKDKEVVRFIYWDPEQFDALQPHL